MFSRTCKTASNMKIVEFCFTYLGKDFENVLNRVGKIHDICVLITVP